MGNPYDLLSPHDENHVRIKQATSQGYIVCPIGGVADLSFPSSKSRRGRVQDSGDICPTIMASGNCCLYRIERSIEK